MAIGTGPGWVGRGEACASKTARPKFTPQREKIALAFVGDHHPELAALLKTLAPMNRNEYEKAIVELSSEAQSLENLRHRDERRYELALAVWKTRSRVELLAAQLAGLEPESAARRRLESRLRSTLEAQVDAEIQRQRYDQEQTAARAERLLESLDRLKRNRDKIVDQRFQSVRRKSKGRVVGPRDRDEADQSASKATATARDQEGSP